MKTRLTIGLAAAALVAAMLPGVASAKARGEGRAVIVTGDFRDRYGGGRSDLDRFIKDHGLTDAWIFEKDGHNAIPVKAGPGVGINGHKPRR